MKTYLDSSFLVSMYVMDGNSPSAAALLRKTPDTLLLSNLSELELANALELRVFRKQLTHAEVDRARVAFEQDVDQGVLRVFELDDRAFLQTKKLILQYSSLLGCRTADILHVAAALEVSADQIYTFDSRQKELARHLKLQTN